VMVAVALFGIWGGTIVSSHRSASSCDTASSRRAGRWDRIVRLARPPHDASSSSCDALTRPRDRGLLLATPPPRATPSRDLATPRPPPRDLGSVLLNPDPSIGLTPPDAGVAPPTRRHRTPPPPRSVVAAPTRRNRIARCANPPPPLPRGLPEARPLPTAATSRRPTQ